MIRIRTIQSIYDFRKPILLVITLSVFNSRCAINPHSKTISAPHLEIEGAGVYTKNRFVDLEIKEKKVIGNSSGSGTAINFSLEKLKRDAIADAILKANADLIVAPFYVVRTENNMIYVEVRGFPANYKKLNQ